MSGFQLFPLLFLIIPGTMLLGALWRLLTAVVELLRGRRLAAIGQKAQGRVISSQSHYGGRGDSNTVTQMIETIEFTSDRGRTVRANPWVAEQHTVDRSGMTVDVLYDRDRPERFIAPQNGRSLSAGRPLKRIGFSLVFLVFTVFFLSRVLPIFGGVDGILQKF
ncbi:DUF3592 domain-containing protein [Brachybacterium sp. J144]|uniref:DUF3592 domain-containing protein n=1 Tax=Brachybacterium sp. J144 TaxID=3116487 RepID=UPI002E7846AF|nr:DUF3592 domain-containing protein [Brachybacterium sp. J144]MEE1650226.1 DUF3592 domain-containing protein [Brachybacterium sp. J144]